MKIAKMGLVVLAGLSLQGCITSALAPAYMPETREARTTFDMYRSEENEPMFRYTVAWFRMRDTETQRVASQGYLAEWLQMNNYCKNGYAIVSNSYQEFPRNDFVGVGGKITAVGKCKTTVASQDGGFIVPKD